jgi:hypothetical protein
MRILDRIMNPWSTKDFHRGGIMRILDRIGTEMETSGIHSVILTARNMRESRIEPTRTRKFFTFIKNQSRYLYICSLFEY